MAKVDTGVAGLSALRWHDEPAEQGGYPFHKVGGQPALESGMSPTPVDALDLIRDDRAVLIWQTVIREILPVALDDAAGGSRNVARDRHILGESAASIRLAVGELPARIRRNIEHMLEAQERGCHGVLAKEAGHMLATLAESVQQEERRTWYLNQAIILLDRLCEVGATERATNDGDVHAKSNADAPVTD